MGQNQIFPTVDDLVTNRASGSRNMVGLRRRVRCHKQPSSRDLPRGCSKPCHGCPAPAVVRRQTRHAVDHRGRALTPCAASALDLLDFVLRVAAEPKEDFELGAASCIRHLAQDGLSFLSSEQKSFLAGERKTRQEMCSISQNLATDGRRFSQHFLSALVSVHTESVETSS